MGLALVALRLLAGLLDHLAFPGALERETSLKLSHEGLVYFPFADEGVFSDYIHGRKGAPKVSQLTNHV